MINVKDETNSAFTPVQDQGKCTRQSSCNKTGCPICDRPRSKTHHVRNLSKALGNSPSPKVSTRPSAPPNRIFFSLTEQLQQAIQDIEMDELADLLEQ